MFGRREAWPAAIILGIGILTLGITLKSAQENMPIEPTWIMGILVALYASLAVGAALLTARALAVFAAMLLTHAVMALLMGWGYAAVEGTGLGGYAALVHGLWDYLPGTALQFGFACVAGMIVAAQLEPDEECEAEEPCGAADEHLPRLAELDDPQAAVEALCAVPGISGAMLADGVAYGGGVWGSDPGAALGRVRAVASRTGAGLNSFPLDQVNLLVRTEGTWIAAIMLDAAIEQPTAHALLRELWQVGERAWPPLEPAVAEA